MMEKVDSDGEVDSSEEEDVVGRGESIDQEVATSIIAVQSEKKKDSSSLLMESNNICLKQMCTCKCKWWL